MKKANICHSETERRDSGNQRLWHPTVVSQGCPQFGSPVF